MVNIDIDLLKSVSNAADIDLVLDCGEYTETLPVSSVCINKNRICALVGYHSALPLNKPTYNVYLCYSNFGELAIARFSHITGDGEYGGLLGLPSCDYYEHYYKSRNWVVRDCYHQSELSIEDIISGGIRAKIKIEIGDFVHISNSSIFINYDNRGYSIRLTPIGFINSDEKSLEITNFEICGDITTRRSWTIWKDAPRFSKAWCIQKFVDARFKSEYKTYRADDCKISFYFNDSPGVAADYEI